LNEYLCSRVAKRTDSDPRCGRIALFRLNRRQRLTLAVLPSEPCPAESVDPRRGFSLTSGAHCRSRIRSRSRWSWSKPNCLIATASALSRFATAHDDDAPASQIGGLLRIGTLGHAGKIGAAVVEVCQRLLLPLPRRGLARGVFHLEPVQRASKPRHTPGVFFRQEKVCRRMWTNRVGQIQHSNNCVGTNA
jgi:hypothetical protein